MALFGWWQSADLRARRAFIAASLGWMLDAFDVMLFSLLLASIMTDLNLTKEQGGALGSITLVAAAAGGLIFGVVADRYGRKRALMASVLLYSIFTALCGVSRNLLAARRVSGVPRARDGRRVGERRRARVGIVAGGHARARLRVHAELLGDRIRPGGHRHRTAAAGVGLARRVLRRRAARASLRCGSGGTSKSREVWQRARREPARSRLAICSGSRSGAPTGALTLMNACTLFGWWGLNTWVPAYLVLPPEQGGVGLSIIGSSAVVFITQVGMWFGYITFGFVADAIGRKRAYAIYVLAASVLLPVYGYTRNPLVLLALGPLVAFFGTGHFSGFGPLTAEIYPTAIRATAQGFTYNAGRLASAGGAVRDRVARGVTRLRRSVHRRRGRVPAGGCRVVLGA